MKQQHVDYQVVPSPQIRRLPAVMLRSLLRQPPIPALIEVDVTLARAHLREQKAHTGEALSFTAFLLACLAQAVEEHKAVQAYRQGRRQLILFEDVDVTTQIEHDRHGQKQAIPSTVGQPRIPRGWLWVVLAFLLDLGALRFPARSTIQQEAQEVTVLPHLGASRFLTGERVGVRHSIRDV